VKRGNWNEEIKKGKNYDEREKEGRNQVGKANTKRVVGKQKVKWKIQYGQTRRPKND